MDRPQTHSSPSGLDSVPLGFGEATATVGDHIAHFFRGDAQRFSVLGPYVQTGLRRDERCVVIARPDTGEALCDWLSDRGIDTEAARAADRLVLHPGRDTEAAMEQLARRIDTEAREDEPPIVRWARDGEWVLDRTLTVCEMLRGKPSTTRMPPPGACLPSASLTSTSSTVT